MSDTKMVEFTPKRAARFVAAYNHAKREQLESFTFDSDEYVVSYAYYVIQYMEMNHVISGDFDSNKIFIVR